MPEGTPADVSDDGVTTRQRRLRPALIVNTGEGKGKTTAAMGMVLRAWQQSWSTAVFQFIKSGKWVTGERVALEALNAEHDRTGAGGPIEFHATGAGRRRAVRPSGEVDQRQLALEAWREVSERLADRRHQLYVLDEFTYPLVWGWIDIAEAIGVLQGRPGVQHIVITGRHAPPQLLGIATTVTSMTKVKHPFDTGQMGQAGIEW